LKPGTFINHFYTRILQCLRRRLLWILLIIYYLSVTTFHLHISNLMFVNPISTPFGLLKISFYMGALAKIALFLLALYFIFCFLKGTFCLVTTSFWIIWLLTVLLTSRFLLFHPNEYIHYPQYAILAVLLALCVDPDRSKVPWHRILFWLTVLGIFDEMNQYFFLCKKHGDYLDFNDMLMNLQGAQAGLLLFYGVRQLPRKKFVLKKPFIIIKSFIQSAEVISILIISALVIFLLYTGILHLSAPVKIPPGALLELNGTKYIFLERLPHILGSWGLTPDGHPFYILSPVAGLLIMTLSGFLYSSFIFWCNKTQTSG
jgi:hypothetical protein